MGSLQYDKFEESLKSLAALGEKQGIVISQFAWKGDKNLYLPLKQDDLNKLNSLGWAG